MTRIEAVVFDLGNVLMFHDNSLLMRRLGERAGLAPAVVEERLRREVWLAADRGELSPEPLRGAICELLGIELDPPAFAALWTSHFAINTALLPQIEALVGRVRLLLLSNTNELHARHCLRELPLLQRFDRRLLSYELGCVKPDPRIFRIALEQAGTAPEATAFFDDLPEFVGAARELGIRAELFVDAREFPAQLQRLGLAPGPALTPA
jgi:putative hydrolase of the HAD superfamily